MTKNRLETFSDSVIAIVITLLALDIRIPVQHFVNNGHALSVLNSLAPQFFIYALSFITISIMWINHHYITNKIERVTHKTVWANSLLLMFLALIPFATDFLGKNITNQVALIVYALVMLFCSISFTVLKSSSVTKGEHTHQRETFKHIGIYSYTFAVFVAIFAPQFTYFVLLVPPLSYIIPKKES